MLKSRQELRSMLSRIEAGIMQLHSSNPVSRISSGGRTARFNAC